MSRLEKASLGWLATFLLASFGAAALGSWFTVNSLRSWYPLLRKPSWNPPNRVFGPVWTILYLHMALSAWLVRRVVRKQPEQASKARLALVAWATQLALNVGWSAIFFGRRSPGAGVVAIGLLWSAIVATVVSSARVSKLAAVLLVPYLAWTTFAAALNVRIRQLNRHNPAQLLAR